MKANKIKIISVIVTALILSIGGVFYYASTKLRPDEIKKLAFEQTQKIFPKSEVQLGNVDIGFGFNFKINIDKFKIDAVKDGNKIPMLSVDQLIVKVPIWAILTNSGVIEIKLEAPELNYAEFNEGNNWTFAMGEKKVSSSEKVIDVKKNNNSSSADTEITTSSNSALGVFGKSKINVRFSDVKVRYALRDNSKGEVKVSKFLIKGMNFETSTAFEVQSNAIFTMKDNSKITFDTLAIGQFNIADLMRNGSVTSNINVKINNISKTGLEMKFPEIVTDIEILLKKDGELSGKLTTSFESQNKINANFKMAKEIEVSDINVDINMKDVSAIAGLDKVADMSKAKLSSHGNINYSVDKKINANLNFAITPGIGYSKDGVVAVTTLSGEIKGKEITGKSKTDIFDGAITSSVYGEIDLNQKFDLSKLKPFEIKILAAGMKVPEKIIRAKLWEKKQVESEPEKKDNQKDAKGLKQNLSENDKNPANETNKDAVAAGVPPSNVIIDWNNILIGGEEFQGHGRIVTSLKSVAIDNLSFKFSKGSGKLTQTMNLGKNSSDSKFNFEIQALNLNSFKSFLPPFVENFTGTFSGKVTGSATMYTNIGKLPQYDVTVIADAKKGEIKKLNIGEYVNPMLANIPIVKDQVKDKQIKVDGNFETFSLKGRFTNSQYSLTSFEFVGLDKKVQINGNGEIYPIAGKNLSSVEANFIDGTGKISDLLLKNTGTKILPMHLTGPGFDLKPDIAFTVNKLAKGALKTKGEEKIKEVVQKNIDKYVPEQAKEKVKGLINGLFK